jgi:transglutaminase-like putative cysteine protease
MRITLFLLLLLVTELVSAKDKPQLSSEPSWLYPVKPDISKPADPKKISNGYYLELFDSQINIQKQTSYFHYIRKIINESGIQNGSEVSVEFSPEYETVTFHYIRVIRNGVILNQLRLNEIKVIQEENDVDQYQYNGLKRAFIILKDIRKDDRIEAAYSLTGFNPVFDNKFTVQIDFSNNNPILNYYQTIIAEESRKLNLTYSPDCPKPLESVEGGSRIYHWNNPPVSLWESTGNTPSWFDPYPSVTISQFNTWSEVVNWGLQINNNYHFDIPAALKTKINEWSSQSNGDDNEFIRKALRFVQDDIRYLGLEIGVNTHRPHAPAEVFKNGYGDCKDKALLLATILRSRNINANAAMVNTTIRGELINKAPSPYEFDHVIVAIEQPGGYRFIDPTLTYQRGSLAEIFTPAYKFALVIKDGENKLTPISHSKATVTRSIEWLKVHFDDTSILTVNTSYGGDRADGVRSYFATTSAKDASDSYLKYYSSLFDGILMAKDIEYADDSLKNLMSVNETYNIPAIWSEDDDKRKYFLTYARLIDDLLPDPTGKSNAYPLSLTFPTEAHYTLKIEMPEAWALDTESFEIKNDYYEFKFNAVVTGSLITLKYSIVTLRDYIPVAEIAQFKKDYKKISKALQYRFSYGGRIGNGDVKPVGGVNFPAIALCLLAVGGAFTAFIFFNRRTIEVPYDRDNGHQLGGWVTVLGLTLIVKGGYQLFNLYQGNYFSAGAYANWQTYGQGFVFTVMFELFLNLFWLLSTAALLYWFFQRRDIFPSMFNGYVTMLIATQAILFLLYKQYANHATMENVAKEGLMQVGRFFIYGGIWCSFLARSHRAKWTFLKAYKG